MLIAAARRRVAAWRQPRTAVRLARVLWVIWAILAWNVVFDHVIVVAGRDYLAAAAAAAAASPPRRANMDAWMRPAVTRGLLVATSAAGAILVTGLVSVGAASRRARASQR